MDIVRFKGGLGNQMFQYAFAEALRSRGREVCCNLGFYKNHPDLRPFQLTQVFQNIDLNEISNSVFDEIDKRWQEIKQNEEALARFKRDLKHRFFYIEEESGKFDHRVFETKNCTFVGYWQTWKYFSDIKERIKHSFVFKAPEEKLKKMAEMISKGFVSVHIRRTDYINNEVLYPCPIEYYQEAMLYMKERIPGARFFFLSDDMDWVKKTFWYDDAVYCEAKMFDCYEDWYDMYLMTKCEGNIIANSSFSWWGGWLNEHSDAVVAAPGRWVKVEDMPDIWCENWKRFNVPEFQP